MIYIVSDIHGQYGRYKQMLEKISFCDEDKLYVLGDAIDRGPGSLETLLDIMERKNVEMFLGNHEHMMLTYLEGSDRESWFYGVNGGRATYEKFNTFSKEKRERIVNYLKYETTIKKDLNYENVRYILSHTGAESDGIDLYTKDYADNLMAIQDFVWNMSARNTMNIDELEAADKETIFISGHIISRRITGEDEVFVQRFENNYSWIDIDCGCAMGSPYGYLATLAVNDEGQIENLYYVK